MSIKPIDMQTLVPKTTEVSRMNQNREMVPQNDQQVLAHKEQQEAEHKQAQVQNSKASVKSANEDGHNKRENSSDGKDEKNFPNEAEKEEASLTVGIEDPLKGHRLDLRM